MHGWIDPFYERAAEAVAAGHVWTSRPIALPPAHGLRIDRVSPRDDAKLDMSVTERSAETFDHPPVKRLGLASDEDLVIAKAPREQRVIVLSTTSAAEIAPAGITSAETVFVVPVHGTDEHPDPTRRRVAAYEFANAFYLPAAPEHRFAEGFARLDHAQPVPRASLTGHRGLALSSDALDALVEWFVAYSTGRMLEGSLILDYRRQKLAELS